MQWLAEICIRRPVFATMLTLAMVVAGLIGYSQLAVDRFPNIDLPTVMVRTTYPGAASIDVENEVTKILEDTVSTVAGIDELRSISSDSSSLLILTFNLDRDIDSAIQDVRDAVGGVLNRLPDEVDPPVVRKQDLDASPIMSLVVSGPYTGRELYMLAERHVKNVIESAPGVGEVAIYGATDRAVQINIDAHRLAAYQFSILDVREAIERQNAEVPGGRVDAGRRELSLRTLGRIPTAREFPEMVVKVVNGHPVRLADLGEVIDYQKEERSQTRYDGTRAVVLRVQRQSGENTVEVIQAVKDRLDQSRQLLPEDVKLEITQDQSRYINAAMHEIQGHLVIGSVLASIVVLLFMRSWRSTLIAAIAIPTSLIATFAVMRAFDFTLNNVTMLALVLMVGVVIDDAIVVLENVFHHIEEKGSSPMQAAVEGTKEIGFAVLATTISLVVVFLPVSFLSSVTGRMLFQFGVTASVAVLISMIISFSLTPMMCSRMLKPVPQKPRGSAPAVAASRGGFYAWIEGFYMWLLRLCMRFRLVVIGLCLFVVWTNIPLYRMVQQDYIPTNVDESEFEIRLTGPEGTSLSAMDGSVAQIEEQLLAMPEIRHILTTVGSSGVSGTNRADIYVQMSQLEGRTFSVKRLWDGLLAGNPGAAFEGNYTQRDLMNQVRDVVKQYPDFRASIRNLTSFRQGAPVDIDFVITGPDLQQLADYGEELRQTIAQIPGIVDPDTTLRMDKPELHAAPNRERAVAANVDTREIADTLRIAVGGDDRVSRYRDDSVDDAYDVELRLTGVDRSDKNAIAQLYVRTVAGGGAERRVVRVDNVADFEETVSPARVDRVDRQRMVAVRANISDGYALGDRLIAVQEAAAAMNMSPAYSTQVMGRGKELERTLNDFGITLLLSFVFMYIILAAQYEHFVHPFTVLLSLPLAVPFGLVSLYYGGETLNLYSALGVLVLFGVVKKASILQVDRINQLRAQGMNRLDAILQGNRDRLRPILMTTIAFVAGLLPLVIGSGPGAEERRSIAILTVGGQTLSLLLTLLAIPVIYSLLDDLTNLFYRKKQPAVSGSSGSLAPDAAAVPVAMASHSAVSQTMVAAPAPAHEREPVSVSTVTSHPE